MTSPPDSSTQGLSLRWVLVVPFVLQTTVAVGLVGAISWWNGRRAVNDLSVQVRQELTDRIRERLTAQMNLPHYVNQVVGDTLTLKPRTLINSPELPRFLGQQLTHFPEISTIYWGDSSGGFLGVEVIQGRRFINQVSPQTNGRMYAYPTDAQSTKRGSPTIFSAYDPRKRPWYRAAVQKQMPVWSEIYGDFTTHELVITAAHPLYDPRGKLLGVLGSDYVFTQVNKFMEGLQIGKTGSAFILERSGNLISTSNGAEVQKIVGNSTQRILAQNSSHPQIRSVAAYVIKAFGGFEQLPLAQRSLILEQGNQFVQISALQDDRGLDWLIVVVIPTQDFLAEINRNTWVTLGLCATAFLLSLLLGLYTSHWINQPLVRLIRAAQTLSRSNFRDRSLSLGSSRIQEIATLSAAFNHMAEQLETAFTSLETRVQERTQALALSEEKFSTAFNASPNPIALIKLPEGIFVEVNEVFCDLLERNLSEILGQTIVQLQLFPNRRRGIQLMRQLVKEGKIRNQEVFYLNRQGKQRIALVSVEMTDFGSNVYMLVMATDITIRKQAELALQEREKMLFAQNQVLVSLNRTKALIQGDLPQAFALITQEVAHTLNIERVSIWLFDYDRQLLICQKLYATHAQDPNQTMVMDIRHYPNYIKTLVEERMMVVNDPTHDLRTQEFVEAYLEPLKISSMLDVQLQSGESISGVLRLERIGVSHHWSVEEQGFARSIADLTALALEAADRRRTSQALQQAKETADAANRAKSDFLASMSHELRTPLNGILGYAQILQRRTGLPLSARKAVETILQSGNHLLNLINDILDFSKIESQKMELHLTPIHLPSFIAGIAEITQVRAEQKNIYFSFKSDPDLPIGIIADEKRLRQVLLNLLSNAIKFTDRGKVLFYVAWHDRERESLQFTVEDTGVGMSQEQLAVLFQAFEQVGDVHRKSEGTGLGLAISQSLVGMMGSHIEVTSTLGAGSRFWFVLTPQFTEVTQEVHPSTALITGYEGRQRKVLVVDDKLENRSVVRGLLEPLGFTLVESADGESGIALARQEKPDLIITDLVMPILDGFEMVRRLRQDPLFYHTAIIASSASVFQADQERCMQIGCNEFVAKPIQAEELLQRIGQVLPLQWRYTAVSPGVNPGLTNPIPIVFPPADLLQEVYDLAAKGSLKSVLRKVKQWDDSTYHGFIHQVEVFVEGFQEEALLQFLRQSPP